MKKYLLPLFVFIFSAVITLYNIGNFPKMIGDEGIYVSQAYHLTTLGELGPYTYWYDHSPLGWLQIGFWQKLVGVASFWGNAVLTSRVLIALLLSATTTLLFTLTRRLTNSTLIGLVSVSIYSLSALTQTFGRMVLLDNLAIFWFMLSLNLLVHHPNKLKWTTYSALTLALSILTKESLLFFIPPYYLLLNHLTHSLPTRRYSLTTSAITLFFTLSFFPLLALLKDELLPKPGQVSLYETVLFQLTRGSHAPFYAAGSHFREMLGVWLTIDPILIIGGVFSLFLITLKSVSKTVSYLTLFSYFYLIFLLRGGQIYDFYIIPLLPLLTLKLSLAISSVPKYVGRVIPALSIISYVLYVLLGASYPWSIQATKNQLEAISYLATDLKAAKVAAPDYAFLDTKLANPLLDIHWYKKLDSDPSFSNFEPDFALLDEQFTREMKGGDLPTLTPKISDFTQIKTFGTPEAPGLKSPPYSREHLTLNAKSTNTPPNNHQEITNYQVVMNNPSQKYEAILINRGDFKNSTDLQNLIQSIKDNQKPNLILITQDSEGNNTIPWINTNGRSFFKSSEEARVATEKKALALSELGLTGAIVATSNDSDGFLDAILSAANPHLTALVSYNGTNLPDQPVNLLIASKEDLTKIQQTGYSGKLFLLNQ